MRKEISVLLLWITFGLCSCTAMTAGTPSVPQSTSAVTTNLWKYQYAAKFVCGKPQRGELATGSYFTAINVHNPHDFGVSLRKKVSVAKRQDEPRGRISPFYSDDLKADQSLEVDCPDIMRLHQERAEFLKGFVVIESQYEIDVVSVYTAAASGAVRSIHTERVPFRTSVPLGSTVPITTTPGPTPIPGQCSTAIGCARFGFDSFRVPGVCPAGCDPALLRQIEDIAEMRAGAAAPVGCTDPNCPGCANSNPPVTNSQCSDVLDTMDEDGNPLEVPVAFCGYLADSTIHGICN